MRYLLLLLAVLLAGCYSAKRAAFQVNKAQGNYPEVVAEKCTTFYPTKDSVSIIEKVIKGKTDTLTQDVFVNCDSPEYRNRIVKVEVPKYIKHNDTIQVVKTKVVESTAKIKSMQSKLDVLAKDSVILNHKLNKRNNVLKWLIGILGLGLILLVAKLKFKFW